MNEMNYFGIIDYYITCSCIVWRSEPDPLLYCTPFCFSEWSLCPCV